MSDAAFTPTTRTQVRRMPKRGHYDRETVHAILDAGAIAHVGYVVDGQPYVTPTAYWRKGERIYWHGSSASRMLRTIDAGPPVCVTVAHIDGFVLARSAFHHSVNYRSVMAFGTAHKLTDEAEIVEALRDFTERLYPGRWDALRPIQAQEIKATTVLAMDLTEAVAKVRTGMQGFILDGSGALLENGAFKISKLLDQTKVVAELSGRRSLGVHRKCLINNAAWR